MRRVGVHPLMDWMLPRVRAVSVEGKDALFEGWSASSHGLDAALHEGLKAVSV
ncbi:hypothetical protein [Bartonella grahamii]|uniref:hypothetical protein n=1 Tax=Bartonella grahamii TaxID=33045 RepID=UPI002E7BEC7D|nr:hypothetical protein [Bartonella grahamii]